MTTMCLPVAQAFAAKKKTPLALLLLVFALTPATPESIHMPSSSQRQNDNATGKWDLEVEALKPRLRLAYEALPRSVAAAGPGASSIRYLARRFLAAEHGWTVLGLDLAPEQHGRPNASSMPPPAWVSKLFQHPAGTSEETQEALQEVFHSETERGFSLSEASRFVSAVERLVAGTDVKLMRQAQRLTARIFPASKDELAATLRVFAVLHLQGPKLMEELSNRKKRTTGIAQLLFEELEYVKAEFMEDMAGEPLDDVVSDVINKARGRCGRASAATCTLLAMRLLRSTLDARHARGCRRFRGIFTSMDHGRTGQLRYASVFGTHLRDWALLETPAYLRAVGVLAEEGNRGGGPGVYIPNYINSINSCRDRDMRFTAMCCPDECELDVLPRLEAVAAGTEATPRQVWSVAGRMLRGDKLLDAKTRKGLQDDLRALAKRSGRGLVAIHSVQMADWLHRAFPHKCKKPAGGAPIVDISLSPGEWIKAGNHLPMDPAEVAQIGQHLQTRWGRDGTGADPASFAARSDLGLDREMELVARFHKAEQAGGPPVAEAMEDALNVRLLSPALTPLLMLLAMRQSLAALAAAAVLGFFWLTAALLAPRLQAAVGALRHCVLATSAAAKHWAGSAGGALCRAPAAAAAALRALCSVSMALVLAPAGRASAAWAQALWASVSRTRTSRVPRQRPPPSVDCSLPTQKNPAVPDFDSADDASTDHGYSDSEAIPEVSSESEVEGAVTQSHAGPCATAGAVVEEAEAEPAAAATGVEEAPPPSPGPAPIQAPPGLEMFGPRAATLAAAPAVAPAARPAAPAPAPAAGTKSSMWLGPSWAAPPTASDRRSAEPEWRVQAEKERRCLTGSPLQWPRAARDSAPVEAEKERRCLTGNPLQWPRAARDISPVEDAAGSVKGLSPECLSKTKPSRDAVLLSFVMRQLAEL